MSDDAKLRWQDVEAQLRASRSYWLATARPDGRPHSMPVWGVWRDGAVWFGTGQTSQKGRNMAHQPYVVVHLESGDDVVILEGQIEKVTDRELAEPVFADYAEKYDMAADEAGFELDSPTGGALYRLRPRIAHAWREYDFEASRSRWEPPPQAS